MNLKKKKSIKKCSPEVKTKLSKCEIQWRENIFTGEKGGFFFFSQTINDKKFPPEKVFVCIFNV